MRLRSLAVVVLVSGCQQSTPPPAPAEPPIVMELPAGTEKASGAESVLALAPGAAQAPAADVLPEQSWSVRSADGRVEVRQLASRHGKDTRCESSATMSSPLDGSTVMWKWNTCIATREQLKFISPDGKRAIVLEPLPVSTQGDWRHVEVATLYEHGLRMRGTTVGALVGALDPAPEPSQRFVWLKDTAPRYTSDGMAVEAETADGRSLRLGFQGQGFPEPASAATTVVLYRYEDDKKTSHFVGALGDVPDRYRSRAVPVQSEVGLLIASGPLDNGESPPSKPKPELKKALLPLPQGLSEALQGKSPAQLLEEAQQGMKQLKDARRDLEQLDSER